MYKNGGVKLRRRDCNFPVLLSIFDGQPMFCYWLGWYSGFLRGKVASDVRIDGDDGIDGDDAMGLKIEGWKLEFENWRLGFSWSQEDSFVRDGML